MSFNFTNSLECFNQVNHGLKEQFALSFFKCAGIGQKTWGTFPPRGAILQILYTKHHVKMSHLVVKVCAAF